VQCDPAQFATLWIELSDDHRLAIDRADLGSSPVPTYPALPSDAHAALTPGVYTVWSARLSGQDLLFRRASDAIACGDGSAGRVRLWPTEVVTFDGDGGYPLDRVSDPDAREVFPIYRTAPQFVRATVHARLTGAQRETLLEEASWAGPEAVSPLEAGAHRGWRVDRALLLNVKEASKASGARGVGPSPGTVLTVDGAGGWFVPDDAVGGTVRPEKFYGSAREARRAALLESLSPAERAAFGLPDPVREDETR
jgi:hypothetical protein